MIFLLLVALVVLGPEKLPEAVRKFTKTYSEFKKMANGFQGELRQALDEPIRELKETANAVRDAAKFDDNLDWGKFVEPGAGEPADAAAGAAVSEVAPRPAQAVQREAGLNFGSANPRRQARANNDGDAVPTDAVPTEGPATE